jgi:hypothetical protein
VGGDEVPNRDEQARLLELEKAPPREYKSEA